MTHASGRRHPRVLGPAFATALGMAAAVPPAHAVDEFFPEFGNNGYIVSGVRRVVSRPARWASDAVYVKAERHLN